MRRVVRAFVLTLAAFALLLPLPTRADEDERGARPLLVLGEGGGPLDQVVVAAAVEDDGAWVLDVGVGGRVVDLEDGLLRPEDLEPAERAALVVWAEGHAAVLVGALEERAILGVRLLPAAPLTGRVRFAAGRPAVDAPVRAVATTGSARLVHRTRTAGDGTWRLPYLGRGVWRLDVARPDGRRQDLGLFPAGEQADLGDLVVEPGGRATALILDGDASRRTPAAGIRLTVRRLAPAGDGGRAQATQEDGTVTFEGLGDAVYELALADDTYVFDPAPPRFEARRGVHFRLPAAFVVRKRAIRGQVEGVRGEPLGDVLVEALPDPEREAPAGGWRLPPPTRTDADGRFSLGPLVPAATYRLTLSRDGYAPQVTGPVEVLPGRDTATPPVRLLRGWRVEARAQGPGGRPAAGVELIAFPSSHPVGAGASPYQGLVRRAVTDAEGRAILRDLAAEDARVVGGGSGWLESTSLVPYPRTGDVRLLNVQLLPAPVLRGRIVSNALDTSPSVRVVAVPRDGGRVREVTPDEEGRFAFENLHATPTDVVVYGATSSGAPLARYESAMPGDGRELSILVPELLSIGGRVVDAGRAEEVDVELEAPVLDVEEDAYRWRTVDRQRVRTGPGGAPFVFQDLAPGAYAVRLVSIALDSEAVPVLLEDGDVADLVLSLPVGGRIAGTVLDARDRPLLGARVGLVRLRGDGDAVGAPAEARTRVTDADGAYVFEDVAPGLWRIEASDREVASHVEVLRVEEGESALAPDIVLGEGGTIEGRVADPDGRGLDGARLTLTPRVDGLGEREVRTGANGRFRVTGLGPGVWRMRLRAQAGAFTGMEALAEVTAGEVTRVDLAAPGRGRIQGTVRRRGRAAADVTVRLLGQGGFEEEEVPRRLEARTDVRGEFFWDGLVPGRYVVDVVDGVVRSTRTLELGDGDRLDLDLEVWEARIPGRVVSDRGVGLPGVEVVARPRASGGTEIAAHVRTDPEGRFVLAGLPAGAYDLMASAPGRPPAMLRNASAEVPPAERPAVIVVGRGGTLDVDVLSLEGRGVPGASVWLEDEVGGALHAHAFTTTASGRLRLVGIPPGRHFVRVQARRYGRPARSAVRVRENETESLVVRLGPSASLEVRLAFQGVRPPPTLRVRIVRVGTGEVVEEGRAVGYATAFPAARVISRRGRARFDDLGAGDYVVHVEAGEAFEPIGAPVTLEAGEAHALALTLEEKLPSAD